MNDTTIITLSGDYDATRRDELDQLLDRYGDADPLVFDLQAVDHFDTAALRSLVRFQRARREAGRSPLVLVRPSASVRDFFVLAELERTFTIQNEL
jgi:anti-anti-sigma factor